ncbi:hypothetical protein Sjap_004157 [Stephania japonica]|uniref:Uncharacterized protein n=1 Tax=Stephania japonica TaxID=461633 RepID=A0AAP0K2N8_9MAGN
MYGDCQVLSSMRGNVATSDSLFPSPIRNPNLNFMSFNPFSSIIPKEEANVLQRGISKELAVVEEMNHSGSGSGHVEGGSNDEQEINEQHDEQQPNKKKRYHRHTARQIQEMEAMFKECPHPDDKQRMKLSQELGLKPRQVKFWFQNRRTQMKAQQDRSDNLILRTENESLKNDNFRLQAALRNIICPNCGGPAILGEVSFDEHLRLENARLKDELDRLSCITSRYSDRPIHALGPASPLVLLPSLDLDMGIYARNFQETLGSTCNVMNPISLISENPHSINHDGIVIMEHEKSLVLEFAMSATDELVRMCQAREPLWIQSSNVNGGTKEELNFEEHARLFPWAMKMKLQHHQCELRTEATRDTAVVIMNSITLADAFLDANKWMELFPSIVARARTIQVVTTGVSGHASGSLHLMYAELQALTPLVPTRETYFLRYCQQNVEEGTWTIVDFPVDGLHESHSLQLSSPRYYRRPSGCVLQDMPNGYSRVTWVEHGEVEVKPVHQIFNHFVKTGMAFGAKRWLAVLQQQCERLASLLARNISDLGVIPSPEARKNMMKLAQRMIKTFCYNISTSGGQSWTTLSDSSDDNVRITTRRNTEPGQPSGLILCAVSTIWLPFSQHQVFDLLRDEQRRAQLDFLSSGAASQEVAHIANGSHPGNCISLLRINVSREQLIPKRGADAAGEQLGRASRQHGGLHNH